MVNHQAGAALLMQQQQQEYLSKMKNKYAGFEGTDENSGGKVPLPDLQTGGGVFDSPKDPVRQHAAKNQERKAFEKHRGAASEREEYVDDDYLRTFFKENYGITIPEEGTVKDYLAEHGKELKSGKRGVVKMLEDFKKQRPPPQTTSNSENLEAELAQLESRCERCLPLDIEKWKGSWTQVYGNPTVVRQTYSTILSLLRAQGGFDGDRMTVNMTKNHASCVGLEVGEASHSTVPVNLFFRDDSALRELHEMNGNGAIAGDELKLDLSLFQNSLCLVRAGPAEVQSYEYVVLAETTGEHKCTSYHVFARDVDEFNLRHYDDIADFLKTEVLESSVLPVGALPKPKLCTISGAMAS
ncbi:Protein F22F4.1 [Aphelenchoides avenae]|nr:Protein F22F4.1 [Aphelenchus avenae]